MSAESPGVLHRLNGWRLRFRAWRGSRPFWAGLLTIAGGVPIGALPYYNIKLGHLSLQMATQAGAGGLIIGVLLITLGLTMWFHSVVRVFAGIASIVLALVSIPVSNFGGLIIGFLLSMTGGALAVAWAPASAAGGAREDQESDEPEGDGETAADTGAGERDRPDPGIDILEDINGGRYRAG